MRILPDVAGKISEPLSKTEKIVIINSGNGPGGGASKLTGDVTQIVGQLPPVIESLTGIKFEKLLEQVPALRKAMEKDGASGKQTDNSKYDTRDSGTYNCAVHVVRAFDIRVLDLGAGGLH